MRIYQGYCPGTLIHLCGFILAALSQASPALRLPSAAKDHITLPGSPLLNLSDYVSSPPFILPPDATNANASLHSLPLSACTVTNNPLSVKSSRHSLLPPDPYTYVVPNSLVTVTIYAYSAAIPEGCARICITKANREMTLHVRNSHEPIGRHLKYSSLLVDLTLNAWPMMTWEMWRATLMGLEHFIASFQTVGLEFDVESRDLTSGELWMVGVGRMGSVID